MPNCDILLNAKLILTQDANRTVLEDASLAIGQGKILAVGDTKQMAPLWQSAKTLNLSHALVLPGLVNAHTHVAMTFLRGFADDLPLMEWLETKIFPREAKLTQEIVEITSLLGFAEMLSTGTTALNDMYFFGAKILNCAQKVGIRFCGGEAIFGFPSPSAASFKAALEQTLEMLELTKDDPLCSIMLNPHSVYTTNREILNSIGELARTKNLALHMHLSESKSETAQSLELHNLRPVDYLKDLGFLDLPCSLAHVVDVDSHDLDLLAANPQTVIIHNPSSNLKLASGFAPIPNMLKRNLKVSLGTDSCASNNQLNMFLEMRQAALMHKGLNLDPTLLPAQKVLDFATLGGAQAFHQSSFGSLEVGKSADLIALDLRKPNLQPLYAPASQVVYAATGHEVILTMVAGKVLYDEGHFTTLDYPLLCEEMAKIRAYFMKIS